jgi:acyl-CoA dehydrogenase
MFDVDSGSSQLLSLDTALNIVRKLGPEIAEEGLCADREGKFPEASMEALRSARLLSAAVPCAFGGHGFGPAALAKLAAELGKHCASTAMIWAMHQLQVGCLAVAPSRAMGVHLSDVAAEQLLVASVTSERGVEGDLRRSVAALSQVDDHVSFEKHATTVSYGRQADALLVTVRRNESAKPWDQVLVFVRAAQARLVQTSDWDTLGMRGTCSPAFSVRATVPSTQVCVLPFEAIAVRCMVPLAHLLWSAVWTGVAADAVRRATAMARVKARAAVKSGAPIVDVRLARMHADFAGICAFVDGFAAAYPGWDRDFDYASLSVRANELKLKVSTGAVRVVEQALEICGMAGYRNEGDYSVGRHLRDLYSARLMIANDRLERTNAELLLLHGDTK